LVKQKESYREFMSRIIRENTKKVDKSNLNPLLLRIQTLEKKVKELEKKD